MHIATVRVPLDTEGYLARRCPRCRGSFKVRAFDFEALQWPTMVCACCGLTADVAAFTPPDVITAAVAHARNHVLGEVNAMFGRLARSSGRGLRVSHRPAPLVAIPKLRAITDLAIADVPCCQTSIKLPFALAAALFYCPFCGQLQD